MSKDIFYNTEARASLKNGVDKLECSKSNIRA